MPSIPFPKQNKKVSACEKCVRKRKFALKFEEFVETNFEKELEAKECDMDLDGGLNREEFEEFMKRQTADTFVYVTQGLIITLALAPTIAIATKRSTEGVPGIGKVVQKLPNSVYAGLITFAVMMIQKANE